MTSEVSRVRNLIGAGLARGAMYGSTPAYVMLRSRDKSWDTAGWDVKIIVVCYVSQLILLAPPALEGAIRGIIHLSKMSLSHRQAAMAEFQVSNRLVRAAILPVVGYVLIALQVTRFAHRENSSIFRNYYTFRIPYETGRLSFNHVIKPALTKGFDAGVNTVCFVNDILIGVGFYTGVRVTARWAGAVINAGLGLAMNLLGRRT